MPVWGCTFKERRLTERTGLSAPLCPARELRENSPGDKNPVAPWAFCFPSNAQSQVAPLIPPRLSPGHYLCCGALGARARSAPHCALRGLGGRAGRGAGVRGAQRRPGRGWTRLGEAKGVGAPRRRRPGFPSARTSPPGTLRRTGERSGHAGRERDTPPALSSIRDLPECSFRARSAGFPN